MSTAWYEQSFGEDYLIVYKHRDMSGAQAEVRNMIGWLDLPAGAAVFDLCCGMGRHSLALADSGYAVTGMDLSDVLLREARRLDKEGRVAWIKGDMRHIPPLGPFDAVVNLFTSFGYFESDAENSAVLKGIAGLLAPGGKFIVDYLNPDSVVRKLVPKSVRQEGKLTITEHRSIEDGFVRKRIAIAEPGQPERHYKEQVKLYGLDDFRRMTEECGLAIARVYGNYEGDVYDRERSPRMIMVGARKGEQAHGA